MEKSFFRANRRALAKKIEGDFVAVFSSGYSVNMSADENYPFRANANFYYLSGITQENVYLVLQRCEGVYTEYLYIDEYDEMHAKWVGHKLTAREASELSGVAVKNIRYRPKFDADMEACLKGVTLYLDLETKKNTNYNSFGFSMKDTYGSSCAVEDAYPLLVSLRFAKKPCEVEEIERAIAVTKKGIEALMEKSRPSMKEYELEAYFDECYN